jgi:hypothetical protein
MVKPRRGVMNRGQGSNCSHARPSAVEMTVRGTLSRGHSAICDPHRRQGCHTREAVSAVPARLSPRPRAPKKGPRKGRAGWVVGPGGSS